MASFIHPMAVVESGAELGVDVEIGPFAFVGKGVRLGDRTRLHHHAAVEGNTWVGQDCEIFAFTSIGAKTQDLKYEGGNPGTRIGDRNVFREYVSVHAATKDGEFTTLGDDNLFLAHGHIAHDCQVGNHVIASNNTGLAGHVIVEDHVTFGALSGVHQFCRIGAYAMVGGYAKVVQDVCPFFIADGQPAVIRAINKVGLERKGFNAEQLERVKHVYRVLFREGLNRSQAIEKLAQSESATSAEVKRVLDFAARSERGMAPGA